MHLEEGEEGLEDGMSEDDVAHASLLCRRVHRDLQTREHECPQTKHLTNHDTISFIWCRATQEETWASASIETRQSGGGLRVLVSKVKSGPKG